MLLYICYTDDPENEQADYTRRLKRREDRFNTSRELPRPKLGVIHPTDNKSHAGVKFHDATDPDNIEGSDGDRDRESRQRSHKPRTAVRFSDMPDIHAQPSPPRLSFVPRLSHGQPLVRKVSNESPDSSSEKSEGSMGGSSKRKKNVEIRYIVRPNVSIVYASVYDMVHAYVLGIVIPMYAVY